MATNSLAPVQYGTVVGRFVSAVADTPDDADAEPDFTPLAGTVTFTPVVKALLVAQALPDPATVLPTPIVGVLDSTGHLRLRMSDGTPAAVPGVTLIATDDTATNPTGFTYKVSFALKLGTATISYDPFSIAVPAGGTVDLSVVAPVPSTSGSPIVQGPAGEGVPDGGTTGQVLVKTADTDFATAWADPSGSGSSTVDGITDASTVGKEILKASDAAAVLAITGAQPAGSYATSAQGALADTAVQPGSLAAVATSGAYSDLTGQPAIPSTAGDVGAVPTSRTVNGKPLSADVVLGAGDVGAQPAGSYATAAQGAKADTAVQPGVLATVATSGAYSDLTGRPTLGTASGQDSTAFATAAQGAKADSAVQPAALAGFAVFNVESAGVYPSRPSTTGAVIWAGPDQPDPTFMVEGDFWLEESA